MPLRIGTRGSALALAQASEVRARLAAAHGWSAPEAAARTQIVPIKTTGDRIQDRPLYELGGKGLFTKEIEEALLARRIDCAVHSLKDMPAELPDGLDIVCVLPREDPRDAFLSPRFRTIGDLPQGAVIGSTSVRRRAQLLSRRPDLKVILFRGNVETRLRKLADGEADATLLAVAGLKRLDRADAIASVLEPADMLPAVAQGAIGIEARLGDDVTLALLAPLHDSASGLRVAAERGFLGAFGGSCRTPIAALGTLGGGGLLLACAIFAPDGSVRHDAARGADLRDPREAARMGADAGAELAARAGPRFFDV